MEIKDFATGMLSFSRILPFGAPDFKDPDVINFWYQSLKDLPSSKLVEAMNVLCRKERFPSIDQIKAKCGVEELSDEDLARDAIARIRHAIGRYGYPNWEAAAEYIGSVGRHVVQMMGGWNEVCGFETYKELDFALTQAREYAKVAIKKSRSGALEAKPELPSGNSKAKVDALVTGLSANTLIEQKNGREQTH